MSNLCRTLLFCPASNPKLLFTAPIYQADGIIFDLEDSVRYDEKDAARELLAEALKSIEYDSCEVFARINPLDTEFGEEDVRVLVAAGLRRIRLPMTQCSDDVDRLCKLLDQVEDDFGVERGSTRVQCAIETPLGVHNVYEIAKASERIVSISFGAEDYTRSLGIERKDAAEALLYPRSRITSVAALAGIDAIDTVWSDISDMDGFRSEVLQAKNLGFAGKACIHPSQIEVVHDVFTPDKESVQQSVEIMQIAKDLDIEKGGVALLKGKMIDIPVIDKARRIVRLAKGAGLIKESDNV